MRKLGIEKYKELSEANVRLQILQQVTETVHSTLNLGNVFKQITDGFVHSMGYTTAFIATLSKGKKHFEVRALSTKKRLLPKIDKILGFSLQNFSFPADLELSAGVRSMMEGRVLVVKTLAEIAYPFISKKACSILQQLRGTKNYAVPLKIGKEVVGGILITSSLEEVSGEELRMIKSFAQAASNAIKNAKLHLLTKRAEEALRENEKRYKELWDNAPVAYHVLNKRGIITRVNQTEAKMLGYSKKEMECKSIFKFILPSQRSEARKRFLKKISGDHVPVKENRIYVRKDGSQIYVSIDDVLERDKDGKVIGIRTTMVDITARKKAEEALRENEEQLRTLVEAMPEVIYFKDTQGRNIIVNKAYEELVGLKKEQILGKTDEELLPPDLAEQCRKSDEEAIKKRKLIRSEEQTINKGGDKIFFESIKAPLIDKSGNIKGLIGVSRDITDRKQSEERLQIEKARLDQLFESAREGIVTVDKEGRVVRINNEFIRLFGYTPEEVRGRDIDELVVPKGELNKGISITKKVTRGKNIAFEASRRCKDRTLIDVSVLASPIIVNGEVIAAYAIYRDISERKQAEEKIKASLKEKEVLLREIHHRVKNNMQIISSLLRLQSRQIKDKKILDSFNVSQNRIRSMALIHESLYQSKDLAKINFYDYIKRLTIHLFSIYRTGMDGIELKVEVKDIFLDINRAIPCALIVNELVSNSLKHAFPNGDKGEIAVKMDEDKRGRYTLIVRDTGIGFPEKVDFHKTETLGMQLVTDLVRQLKGNIKLKRLEGTEFRIVF